MHARKGGTESVSHHAYCVKFQALMDGLQGWAEATKAAPLAEFSAPPPPAQCFCSGKCLPHLGSRLRWRGELMPNGLAHDCGYMR